MNELGYFVTRIEEEHLWEAKQLGAHSPQVLLWTLLCFEQEFNLVTLKYYSVLLGASEHFGVLQHEVLPAEDCGHAPEALLLAHHEALEENQPCQQARAAAAHRLAQVRPLYIAPGGI